MLVITLEFVIPHCGHELPSFVNSFQPLADLLDRIHQNHRHGSSLGPIFNVFLDTVSDIPGGFIFQNFIRFFADLLDSLFKDKLLNFKDAIFTLREV